MTALFSSSFVSTAIRKEASMRIPLALLAIAVWSAATAAGSPAPGPSVASVALPGAPAGGLFLDYLAVDRANGLVWVPAGATGTVVVIEAASKKLHRIEGFPTAKVERRGSTFAVGPSSATVGERVVYVGNRGDSTVCAIDSTTLAKAGCVSLPGSPDGVVYVARTKQMWVTTPRDRAIVVVDVAAPKAPKVAGSFTLPGDPEGYAVDDAGGFFYTNLEDRDRTLKIDLTSHKILATWAPACGERGPRGLALDPSGKFLMVACTDHVEVVGTGDGRIVSKLETGEGVDNLDYVPKTRSLYAAAGRAGTLTIATLDANGRLTRTASIATATGARNAVVAGDGTVFIGDGAEGRVVVVGPGR
jgi:DNA-binding beta-propeller fold protein YncE